VDLIVAARDLDRAREGSAAQRLMHLPRGGPGGGPASGMSLLSADDGTSVPLDVGRWHGEVDEVESQLLASLIDPVLDIGCGPGRIGAALSAAGRTVLGIDPAPAAIAWALARGAPALCRSVFDPLPDEGRWVSALLLDGNIGIGGDPSVLLARICDLLAPGGEVVAEVTAPGGRTGTMRVCLRGDASGPVRPWFPWARVSVDAFPALAGGAGLVPGGSWHQGERWFARASRP
jgi:SAM-dependent methyltransferase